MAKLDLKYSSKVHFYGVLVFLSFYELDRSPWTVIVCKWTAKNDL